MASLYTERGTAHSYQESTTSGATVASYRADLAARLALSTVSPRFILANFGANDVAALPAEATWEADYLAVIDGFVAKWPTAKFVITRPWRRGYATECNTLATRIDHIVAARPDVAFVGDDERVWLEGGDNGATMTIDGTHYSAAGDAEKPRRSRAALPGY